MLAIHHVGFQQLEILTAVTVWRASVHHYAEFRANRSNCSGDVAIFARDTVQAQYMLLSFVHPSVCLPKAGTVPKITTKF